jgi:lambda family phage tail tape measure protein
VTDVTSIALAVDSRQVRTATQDLEKFAGAGRKTEKATEGMTSAFGGLKGVVGGLSAALLVRSVIQTADAYTSLSARIRLVTAGSQAFARAQAEVFAISQRTRTSLGETGNLYTAIARSTQQLGVTQREVLGVTETINQAIIVSGSSAQSAAAALVQLGQGFASGTLRGEELNSILEQTPRLAQAIADGLGVPIGALRKLGSEGQLSADKVFRALQRSATAVRDEFGNITMTVGQASQQIGNALSELIGQFDQLSGSSSFLANRLSSQSSGISALANEFRLARIEGQGFLEVIARIFKFFAPGLLGGGITTAEDRLASLSARLSEVTSQLDTPRRLGLFSGQAAELEAERARIISAINAIESAINPREAFSDARFDAGRKPKPTTPDGKGSNADPFGDAVKGLREQIALVGALTELDKTNANIKLGTYGKLSAAQQTLLRSLGAELDLRKSVEADREAALGIDLSKIQRDLASVTGAYKNAEQVLDALRDAAKVSDKEYFDSKLALLNLTADAEVRALEAENQRIASEKASGEARIRNQQQIAENEARIAALRGQQATQVQVLAIQQQSAAEKIAQSFREAEDAAQDYLDTLRRGQSIELAGLGLGSQERDRQRGRAQIEDKYSGERQKLERQNREGKITDQALAAELDRIKRFQAAALASYDQYYAARLEQEADFAVGASEALANYVTEAANVAQQTEQLFTKAFKGMEDALVQFVTTGKLDFKSLADSIVADIVRIIIKQQISNALGMAGKAASGGGGFFGELLGAVLGSGRAIGGPVSAGKIYPINEKGTPEIASFQGRDYLLTGSKSGEVKPATDSASRPANITINQTFAGNVSKVTMDQAAAEAGRAVRRSLARGTA